MSSPAPGRPDSLRPVIGAVVLLFFALLAVAGLKGYRDLTASRARERDLLTRIDGTRTGIEKLRGRIERLRGDPVTLERLARGELGMVLPRDVVIELPAGSTGPAALAASPRASTTVPPPHAPASPAPAASSPASTTAPPPYAPASPALAAGSTTVPPPHAPVPPPPAASAAPLAAGQPVPPHATSAAPPPPGR